MFACNFARELVSFASFSFRRGAHAAYVEPKIEQNLKLIGRAIWKTREEEPFVYLWTGSAKPFLLRAFFFGAEPAQATSRQSIVQTISALTRNKSAQA